MLFTVMIMDSFAMQIQDSLQTSQAKQEKSSLTSPTNAVSTCNLSSAANSNN